MRRWSKERGGCRWWREGGGELGEGLVVCFIYQYETINRGSCQELFQHFYDTLFFDSGPIAAPPSRSDGTMTLGLSARRTSVRKIRGFAKTQRTQAPRFLSFPASWRDTIFPALMIYSFSVNPSLVGVKQ